MALFGTLYQDLAAQLGNGVWQHCTIGQPRSFLAHPASVIPGTRLAGLVGEDLLLVNSFHHQAIKRLGEGLRIAALAPDDVIEAVEAPKRRFVLGTQWSLEALAMEGDQRMLAVFQRFIEAASTAAARCRRGGCRSGWKACGNAIWPPIRSVV